MLKAHLENCINIFKGNFQNWLRQLVDDTPEKCRNYLKIFMDSCLTSYIQPDFNVSILSFEVQEVASRLETLTECYAEIIVGVLLKVDNKVKYSTLNSEKTKHFAMLNENVVKILKQEEGYFLNNSNAAVLRAANQDYYNDISDKGNIDSITIVQDIKAEKLHSLKRRVRGKSRISRFHDDKTFKSIVMAQKALSSLSTTKSLQSSKEISPENTLMLYWQKMQKTELIILFKNAPEDMKFIRNLWNLGLYTLPRLCVISDN